ncbi:hypothetical protein JL107_00295 [Nakamurella flavida]|uniref:Uncharacterized protein n=1 Tax=Nakamurella flavida TaxID=363630 RepID=A0A938YC03_9ACTN|nr:hypothetical protein [Nakamurella flavida]MBM9474876.1 hypothetical protein [Nakamurella flavida]MDP9776446.1 thiol:disulfide interchange protein [Nakamurella flavida]
MTRPARRPPGAVRPAQVVVVVLVLAVFLTAVLVGGAVGAAVIAALALAAGVLLAVRWSAMDRRIRVLRLVTVLACLAVAVSVAVRG